MKEQQKQTIYQMLLVKPYQREGEKKYSYTNIGVAFRKGESDIIDMKLDLFPILIPGAFIQLKPTLSKEEREIKEGLNEKNINEKEEKVKKSKKPKK